MGSDGIEFEIMGIDDYDATTELWRATQGLGLSGADERKRLGAFLLRNPESCFVARDGGAIVGTVLCGNDGRRGYIYHLAVAETHRRRGIGRGLLRRCMDALEREGIEKCHLFVFSSNGEAKEYYGRMAWTERRDLAVFSSAIPPAVPWA